MSPTTKLEVAELEVKIIAIVESFEVEPSETVDEVIAIVGATSVTTKSHIVPELLLSTHVCAPELKVPEVPDANRPDVNPVITAL